MTNYKGRSRRNYRPRSPPPGPLSPKTLKFHRALSIPGRFHSVKSRRNRLFFLSSITALFNYQIIKHGRRRLYRVGRRRLCRVGQHWFTVFPMEAFPLAEGGFMALANEALWPSYNELETTVLDYYTRLHSTKILIFLSL